jgi:hypothetical protein
MKPFFTRRVKILHLIFFISACISTAQAQVKFGNSYINRSKRTIGGTVQPGDTLEIRTNCYFPTNFNSNAIYRVRYIDNVPTKTTFCDDSLRLITNEGLTFKNWTLAGDTDPATYLATPPAGEYNVRINIGRAATAPTNNTNSNVNGAATINTGANAARDKPHVGGGMLITTSFKVRVTGAVGDTIIIGAGQLRYKLTSTGADVIQPAVQYKILIANNDPICPNAVGRNFVSEYGGTFDSGTVQNRVAAPSYLIPSYVKVNLSTTQAIGDGQYAIVNNLSPWASTYQNADKRPNLVAPTGGNPPVPASGTNRMFGGYWDIIGDHTGSTTPAGNTPKAVGTLGGYMLAVNADYVTTEAYRQDITGLCPNTTYEFSLWVKNVCTNCGIDSSGVSTYKPGVLPNLSFSIDGLDRYSSGMVDTIGWLKKGFLFRTGVTQTAITISIRNNASGGGGNDWVIDDIALVTCNPNLNLVPSGNAQVCYNDQVDISSSVTSFFNNYTFYRFERSIDNGSTWTVPSTGSGVPTPVPGGYQYTAQLVPSFLADSAHHMNQYRFIVASSSANLSNVQCSFMASTRIVVMVNNCSVILNAKDTTGRIRRSVNRTDTDPSIRKLINPFSDKIAFNIVATEDSHADITITDNYGRVLKYFNTKVSKGNTPIIIEQVSWMAKGTYFLRVELNNQVFSKVLVKTNR